MDRGRVGEDRGSKETDGCPLTTFGSSDAKPTHTYPKKSGTNLPPLQWSAST
jgi:hypothetical protein